jgi:predicted polyphosphate/ATP-dependent NAD kinase
LARKQIPIPDDIFDIDTARLRELESSTIQDEEIFDEIMKETSQDTIEIEESLTDSE